MNKTDMILTTAGAQAEAVGLSRWTIQAMRKAGRQLGDPVGRFTTRRWLMAWLHRHPEFVASHWLGKNAKPVCTGSDHQPAVADKSDALSGQHDLRKP
jgi:hypothetical protein